MSATTTRSLDLRSLPEGAQLATAAIAMLELHPGELLEVQSDAPDAPRDVAIWCRASGHRLLEHHLSGDTHHFLIQRQPGASAAPEVFTGAELNGLPGPVRGYLGAAIAPGTSLTTAARLRMRGHIKVGRWLPFRAEQTLDPRHGFQWTARAAGVISGSDRYFDGRGELRWKLLGLIPLMRADGPDVSRGAAGRAAAEAIWVPTALLPRFGVEWSAADERHLTARYRIDALQAEVHFVVDPEGRLRSVVFDRWGDPDGTGIWGLHPFGGEINGYATFEGLTIPSSGRFGWFFGTDRWDQGEFFRYQITELRLTRRSGAAR
jgi:TusA-related sulfurtransferase